MICSKHPVPAAMFMIVSLVGVAALFVLLEAFFLAVLQILVYAGAVMVLFLFIIMLLDVGPEGGKASRMKLISGFAGAFFTALLVVVFLIMVQSSGWINNGEGWSEISDTNEFTNGSNLIFSASVKSFGYGLLTKYMLPGKFRDFCFLLRWWELLSLVKS